MERLPAPAPTHSQTSNNSGNSSMASFESARMVVPRPDIPKSRAASMPGRSASQFLSPVTQKPSIHFSPASPLRRESVDSMDATGGSWQRAETTDCSDYSGVQNSESVDAAVDAPLLGPAHQLQVSARHVLTAHNRSPPTRPLARMAAARDVAAQPRPARVRRRCATPGRCRPASGAIVAHVAVIIVRRM